MLAQNFNPRFIRGLNKTDISHLETYLRLLLDYNKKVNLVSRKITMNQLIQLVNETLQLNTLITNTIIIDAGSGSGLLGIPLAIVNKNKNIILVEKRQKKVNFLLEIKNKIPALNLAIKRTSIEDYFKQNDNNVNSSIIARGFPDLKLLVQYLIKGMVNEAILITSEKKIRKIKKGMESILKKTYNIPLRNEIKLIRMEYVSRETNQKKM